MYDRVLRRVGLRFRRIPPAEAGLDVFQVLANRSGVIPASYDIVLGILRSKVIVRQQTQVRL